MILLASTTTFVGCLIYYSLKHGDEDLEFQMEFNPNAFSNFVGYNLLYKTHSNKNYNYFNYMVFILYSRVIFANLLKMQI